MKKTSIFLVLLAVLGLSVACDRSDDMQREEVGEEIGHEMDEMGDNIHDATEEVVD